MFQQTVKVHKQTCLASQCRVLGLCACKQALRATCFFIQKSQALYENRHLNLNPRTNEHFYPFRVQILVTIIEIIIYSNHCLKFYCSMIGKIMYLKCKSALSMTTFFFVISHRIHFSAFLCLCVCVYEGVSVCE